jgi:hypothetical protein
MIENGIAGALCVLIVICMVWLVCHKHNVVLIAVLCWNGVVIGSSAADWLQLQGLKIVSTLLLPHHRPPLLPAMIENGIASALGVLIATC